HLHVRVRWIADDRKDYCILVSDSLMDVGDTVRGDPTIEAELRVTTESQSKQVYKSMLVLIPHIVERPHREYVITAPTLWVRLQPLDKCLWAGPDAPNLVHSTLGRPSFLALRPQLELFSLAVNGEPSVLERSPAVVNCQPVDTLLQRRPEIMDRLSEDCGPHDRYGFEQVKAKEVLTTLVVNLWNKQPWPRLLGPHEHFVVEDTEVLVRSFELGVYPRDGVLVDLHDVISEEHETGTERERTDAADTTQEGQTNSHPGTEAGGRLP
ncbi:MAG: hypothetical protein ABSB54_17295, partial [Acidimicrobiales bacterium]